MATANIASKSNVFGMASSIRNCAVLVAANDSAENQQRRNAVLFVAQASTRKF
jgi:hypothetical protein